MNYSFITRFPDLLYVLAVKHYVRFFLTASSGIQNLPEFIGFATFDDIQSAYCDSSGRAEPRQEWARRFSQKDPQHLNTYIQECERHKYVLGDYMKDLNPQMNQTEGQSSASAPSWIYYTVIRR